jgi:Aminoglycoside-2''-adenylyltransferase
VTQLDALRDVVAAFGDAGIDYWLFGGWAVDFYAGAVTRDHDDVDLAIWLNDMPRIESVLSAAGWTDLRDPDVDGGKAFGREGVRLELTYLYRDDDGEIYTPLLDGTRGRWTREALGEDVATLDGVRVRIVALAPLTRMKARGRGDDPLDAAKDKADHDALRNLAENRTFS